MVEHISLKSFAKKDIEPMADKMGIRENNAALLKFFERKAVVHDVGTTYPDLEVEGIEHYATRSLLVPGQAVYLDAKSKGMVGGLQEYYRSIGIGPQEVRYVTVGEGQTLTEQAMKDLVERSVDDLPQVSFFGQSQEVQEGLLAGMNVDGSDNAKIIEAKQKLGLPPILVSDVDKSPLNSKSWVRGLLDLHADLHSLNVAHVRVPADQNLREPSFESEVDRVLQQRGSVYVKRVNAASGEGLCQAVNVQDAISFIEAERKQYPEASFVIEEDLTKEKERERSAQFLIDEGSEGIPLVRFLGMTENIVKGKSHQGNLITTDLNDSVNKISPEQERSLGEIASYMADCGYRGYLSLDLIELKGDEPRPLKVLEANVRITGATYPLLVRQQLLDAGLIEENKTTVLRSCNTIKVDVTQHPDVKTFEALEGVLKEKGWLYTRENERGVIPTLIALDGEPRQKKDGSMMEAPHKFGIVTVAHSAQEAEEVEKTVRDFFSPKQAVSTEVAPPA